MLVVTRYRLDESDGRAFLADARVALTALADRPGFLRGHVGRATDDPTTWVLSTEWDGVGSYRRALSSYDVKMRATPVLQRAVEEPTAFEVLESVAGPTHESAPSHRAADAGTAGPGSAAEPHVASDLD